MKKLLTIMLLLVFIKVVRGEEFDRDKAMEDWHRIDSLINKIIPIADTLVYLEFHPHLPQFKIEPNSKVSKNRAVIAFNSSLVNVTMVYSIIDDKIFRISLYPKVFFKEWIIDTKTIIDSIRKEMSLNRTIYSGMDWYNFGYSLKKGYDKSENSIGVSLNMNKRLNPDIKVLAKMLNILFLYEQTETSFDQVFSFLEYKIRSQGVMDNTNSLELPAFTGNYQIRYYEHFTVSYNEKYELANWVAYELTKDELEKNYDRTDDFRPDPEIITGTANANDYSGSGYDRGHLMPAADCTWNLTAMTESFYYTNIAPQVVGLNRGEWSELEEDFRDLAMLHDTIWIVTGPIFDSIIEYIGDNNVAVPGYYYKAGLYKVNNQFITEAYILPNESIDNNIQMSSFKVTIDSLEKRIGFDLFHKYDQQIVK